MLHVCIAWQFNIALSFREVRKRRAQMLDASREIQRGVAQVKPQCGQDLVVRYQYQGSPLLAR